MKHVKEYHEYINESKKQHKYDLKIDLKKFNLFDLLDALKPMGGEILDSQPLGDAKDKIQVSISMSDSKKNQIEEEISKFASIIAN